jgi:hypothetical protein
MENPLCKYKDIIGKPGTGVHSYRFMGFAIVDVLVTLLGAILIARLTRVPMYYMIPGIFLIGIIAHRMFCVRSTVDRILFPSA